MDKQKFEEILDKDEQVLSTFRMNKCKFGWAVFINYIFSVIWFYLGLLGFIPEEGNSFNTKWFFITLGIITGAIIVVGLFVWLFASIYFKNKYYAYTNKRILIRSGVIGIDYRSLEFKSLNATVVKVSILDKLVRKNTGAIFFGSPSSPVVGTMGGFMNPYSFRHIEKPYDKLKEVKERIELVTEK